MSHGEAIRALASAQSAMSGRVALAGCTPGERRAGDPPEKIAPVPRLMIMLSGSQRIGHTHRGERREVVLRRGDALHYATNAWDLHFWGGRSRFLGVVFHRSCIRVLVADYPGAPAAAVPARWLHTDRPIDAVGRGLLSALDAGADSACAEPTIARIFSALVAHTAESVARASPQRDGGAARTWRAVMDVLAERAREPLTRAQAAAAVGIHPGYLSALCSSKGRSFRRALEDVRCEQAARMLREQPGLPVARIASLCGYATASAFIRMFHRVMGTSPAAYRSSG